MRQVRRWSRYTKSSEGREGVPHGARAVRCDRTEGRKLCSRLAGEMVQNDFPTMTFAEIASALPKNAVTSIDGLPFPRVASGKVREIFDLGDALLLSATDRLSAFDIVLPDGIPGKGAI